MLDPTLFSLPEEPRPSDKKAATLVVSSGTAYSTLAEYLSLLPENSIVLVSDVPAELAKLRLRPAKGRILKTVGLGAGQTATQLIETHGTKDQVKALRFVASTSSEDGLSQLRGYGAAAARALVSDEGFQRLIKENVIPSLVAMSGGILGSLRYISLQGTGGGAGSEGGMVINDAVCKWVLEETDAIIECRTYLLGPKTFTSPGYPRVKFNAAAATADWSVRFLNPISNRMTNTLFAQELYPVGFDKVQREKLLIEQIQALHAPIVTDHLTRVNSNHAASGPLGGVRNVRSDHFTALPAERVAADVARAYLVPVSNVAATRPDTKLVEDFLWETRRSPQPQEAVESVLGRALMAEPQELLDSLITPSVMWQVKPVLVLRDGRRLQLHDVKSAFTSPVEALADLTDRIRLLKTSAVTTSEITSDIEDELEQLRSHQTKLLRRAEKDILAIQSTSVWSRMQANAAKIERAADSFSELRDCSEQICELQSKYSAIVSANNQLSDELRDLLRKLSRLLDLLKSLQPRGDHRQQKPAVTALPMDEFLGELLSIAESGSVPTEDAVHLLAQGVDYVTPAGLASITKAADDSVDAIVRAARTGKFRFEGPNSGDGAKQHSQTDRFMVYPRVKPTLAASIVSHHRRSGGAHRVAFAKTALGSINIVQVEIAYAKTLGDFFNQPHQRCLQQAISTPLAPFYLDQAEKTLTNLGLGTNGKYYPDELSTEATA